MLVCYVSAAGCHRFDFYFQDAVFITKKLITSQVMRASMLNPTHSLSLYSLIETLEVVFSLENISTGITGIPI